MYTKVTIFALFIAFTNSLPIDEDGYTTSYISSNLNRKENVGHGIQLYYPKKDVLSSAYISSNLDTKEVEGIGHNTDGDVYSYHNNHQEAEEHGPAHYSFHYAVEDHHTGDIKSQKEARHGDVVKGEYSLKEADGTTRTVKYTADKKSGFHAIVSKSGHAVHPETKIEKVEQGVLPHFYTDNHH